MMPSGPANTQKGYNVLLYMQAFPALVCILWAVSPSSFHWHHCFNDIVFGVVGWFSVGAFGLSGRMAPWPAIVLTLEIGFGLVPMVYLLFDASRVGEVFNEKVHKSRIMASIPAILMSKQLGRAVVDMVADSSPSVWWHIYVDAAEMVMYVVCGWLDARDVGEVWFLIYTSAPVALCSFWADHMVLRMRTLLNANARLMQTAFASVVRVDGIDGGRVLESSIGFDALVDGSAMGLKLQIVFTAKAEHLIQLCSPASDNERVVRRLRTTLISISKVFQQDVELRVLSATEDELQNEKGLLLGVSIMGERRPFTEREEVSNPSFFMEQYLDEIGQLRVTEPSVEDVLPELSDVTCFDSVSFAAGPRQRRRRRPHTSSQSSSVSSLSSMTYADRQAGSGIPTKSTLGKDATYAFGRDETPAYGHPWKEAFEVDYLKESSFSTLEDLIASWNHPNKSCCHWHDAVSRLAELVSQMRGWHSCKDQWPDSEPIWQCGSCSALQFEASAEGCWLCLSPECEALTNGDSQTEPEPTEED
jgi:hypothetical protein